MSAAWWTKGRRQAAVLVACCLVAGPATAAPCRSVVVDSLSVHAVQGHPVVTVTVDGEPVSMLLDTGADTTVVTPALAVRLGLRVERGGPDTATGLEGAGPQPVAVTEARTGLTGRGTRRRLLVLDLPGAPGRVAGLAGVDLLAEYDVDLDQVAGQMTLRRASPSCTGNDPPPWPGPAALRLPASFSARGRIAVPVRFNDATVPALLDTGVDGAVMSYAVAVQAGMTAAAWQSGVPASFLGVGLRPVMVHTVRFPGVDVGGEALGALDAAVPEAGPPGGVMLLGNDYLRQRRVLVSWPRRAVWMRPARDAGRPR